jgi:uncharacterized repeat protein (TIGR01451 family)
MMSGIVFTRNAAKRKPIAKHAATTILLQMLLLLAVFLGPSGALFAQGASLGCGTDFYQTRSYAGGTLLLRFPGTALNGGAITATYQWGDPTLVAPGINSIGLNPGDGFIYGLKVTGGRARLIQLGTTGAVDVSTIAVANASIITNGTTAGVTGTTVLLAGTDFTPTAGVFDGTGRYYFAGQGGGIAPPAIYRIDNLAPNGAGNIIVAQVYSLSTALANIGDFAFGPDGNLYGATGTTLVQLALAGNTATVTTKTIATVGGIGSAFFNNAGEFFVFDNGASALSRVAFSFGSGFSAGAATVTSAATISANPVPAANPSSTDGASCITFNADLAVTKTNGITSPTTLPSGSTTTYTIRVTNNGPSIAAGAVFSDPAATGLNKTVVACTAAVGNQCITPPSVAQLQSGLFTLPALTAGQFYEITVTATITATGL